VAGLVACCVALAAYQASPAGRSILAQAVVAAARARSAQLRDVFDSASEPAHARAASTRLKKAVAEGRLKQLSTSDKLAGKLSLADKEASIFDSGSWCRGCAPTFPLANVVSSNAQRVASNNDNMMAMYRKTNKGLAHINKELGNLVGMQRQVDLSPPADTSPYASPYTDSGPYATPYASAYGRRPVGYRNPYPPSVGVGPGAVGPWAPPYAAYAPGTAGYYAVPGPYTYTGYAGDEYRLLPYEGYGY